MHNQAKKYLSVLAIGVSVAYFALPATAQTAMQISDVSVSNITDTKAVVRWNTNIASTSRIDFGLDTSYGVYLTTGSELRTSHEITITSLTPLSTYHFSVTSGINGQKVSTFDRTFKTTEYIDTSLPIISNVHVPYVTATSATFQWETNEIANSVVKFGATSAYASAAGWGGYLKLHDVTLGGLAPGTTYHFQVVSADAAGNTAYYSDMTFTTLFNTESEKTLFAISDIRPLTINDPQLGQDYVTISWNTNKLSNGVIVVWAPGVYANTIDQTSKFRDFFHSSYIPNLKPDTTYSFYVQSADVFGAYATSDTYTFKTKGAPAPTVSITAPEKVLVLGFTTLTTDPATALYRVAGSADIYAVIMNQLYRLTGKSSLARYDEGRAPQQVSSSALEKYPLVHLMKAEDSNTVYHLYRRPDNRILKLAIPSSAAFSSYPANRWSDIVSVEKGELNQYPDAVLVHVPGSATVYLLSNGSAHPFASDAVFRNKGFNALDVVDISATHLKAYPLGDELK